MVGNLLSISSKLGISFVFRIVLPGIVLNLLLLPIVNPIVPSMLRIDKLTDLPLILLPVAVILGLFISLLRDPIYRVYEGRLMCPRFIRNRFTLRMKERVEKKLAAQEELEKSSSLYKELWYWLRMFPFDENGDPTAKRPTRLGNVIEEYELYPLERYGMDSIFYWPRLYLTLPESFVKYMDQLWAEVDCVLYISFLSMPMSLVWLILALVKLINEWFVSRRWVLVRTSFFDLIPSWEKLFIGAIGCIIGGYLVYRISIPLLRRNGEYFKSAFDLYRSNIAKITSFQSKFEKTRWQKAWTYLQYMRIQCPRCKKYYSTQTKKCPHCAETNEVPFDS